MMCRVRQTGNPLAGYHVDSPTDVIQHYWNRFLVLGEEEDEEEKDEVKMVFHLFRLANSRHCST